MPMLTINPSGKTVPSTEGMSILEAVLAAGVKMPHKCEGKAECGSCHIFQRERDGGIAGLTLNVVQAIKFIQGVTPWKTTKS